MGGIVDALGAFFDAIKEVFSFRSKKLDMKNAEDMRQAAGRQDEQSAEDKTAQAIKNKDTDELRNELAE